MGQTRRPARHPTSPAERGDPFWKLVKTAKRLQAPGGCAWDRAQTVDSLLPYLIEEAWEVFDALRRRHQADLQEELGDVLYTVLFMSLIAERAGQGSLNGLLSATRRKMVRRHPHVFGGRSAATPQEAYRQWHASKRLEGKRGPSPSKRFREQLVASWERISGAPRPNATPARGTNRARDRARS